MFDDRELRKYKDDKEFQRVVLINQISDFLIILTVLLYIIKYFFEVNDFGIIVFTYIPYITIGGFVIAGYAYIKWRLKHEDEFEDFF